MSTFSPRTAAEPMAFTGAEVVKGGLWTWLSFMVLLETGMAIYMSVQLRSASPGIFIAAVYSVVLVLGYTAIYGGLGSLLTTLVLTPVAWAIGRRLRHQRSLTRHFLAYAVLGLAVAGLVVIAASGFGGNLSSTLHEPVVAIVLIATVTSVPTGWWLAVRGARRSDRGVS